MSGNKNGLVVVGSVALDSVETVHGKTDDELGGAAVYFSLASRFLAKPHLIGVVGDDFPPRHIAMLNRQGVATEGLSREAGKSFRWWGRYSADGAVAHTLRTELGVFERFQPHIPNSYRRLKTLFLANIDPDLQFYVLEVMGDVLSGMDTMNLWIEHKRKPLLRVLKKVHILSVNDQEARMLTGEANLFRAARALLKLGPRVAIIKKGEHGCFLQTRGNLWFCPAYPMEVVRDTTGAGDSFAGAFMGTLARQGGSLAKALSPASLRAALANGSAVASFTVEGFGVLSLLKMTRARLNARLRDMARLVCF